MNEPLKLPDFIIGGAPRSGTTWLYQLLDRHPDVYMAKPATPEPKFFLVDDQYEQGLRAYSERWFADCPPTRVAGEKSTNYLENAVCAERMARDIPGVKLVFILREPAARAYSNYRWSLTNGLESEDFSTALADEDRRDRELDDRWRYARPHAYFSRGLYAKLLRPYVERFPAKQRLVLRFEDIVGAPSELAGRLHEFLAVTPRPEDALGLGTINPAHAGETGMSPDVERSLRESYANANSELAELLPDFRLWETLDGD